MGVTEAPRQPENIRPAPPIRWLGTTLRVHLVGGGLLPADGAVIAAQRADLPALRAVFERCFPGRQGVVEQAGSTLADRQAHIDRLRAGLDVLVPVEADGAGARRAVVCAIQLARAAGKSISPVGVHVGAVLMAGVSVLPFPWARGVIVVEAPFQVPEQPEQVPETWTAAILHLLNRANGLARDCLATWQRTGRHPGAGG